MAFRSIVITLISLFAIAPEGFAQEEIAARLAEEEQLLRELGYAQTIAELEAKIPDLLIIENAAHFYNRGFDLLQLESGRDIGSFPYFRPANQMSSVDLISADSIEHLQQLLNENRDALTEFHRASQISQAVFITDYSPGAEIVLPHLSTLRAAARLLCLEAELHALQGDSKKAGQSLMAALGTARALRKEPLLISQLVRVAIDRLVVTCLSRVLSHVSLSQETLITFTSLLDPELSRSSFLFALEGESVMEGLNLENLSGELTGQSDTETTELNEWLKRNRLAQLKIRSILFETCLSPLSELPERMEDLETEIDQIPKELTFASIMAAPMARMLNILPVDVAHIEIARTIIAIELYRTKHHKLPENLDVEFFAEYVLMPSDPYSGESLQYLPLKKGYAVYSIGVNTKDDGGHQYLDRTKQREDGDWVLTVAR